MSATDQAVYGSIWYAASRAASPARGPLTAELDVDVCVVGAGLAGLTVAREVARRGWSVAVLEAQRVAWNASGRNTGFVLPGFGAGPERIIDRVGRDHAKALWALSEAGAEYVRGRICETKMPCAELVEGGWQRVSKTDNDDEMEAHADLLAGTFGAAAEFWPAERMRGTLRSPMYFSGIQHKRGFSIHALNYALGLAAAAEAAGARIFEQTPALNIDPGGVRKRVVTPSARVRASHIVRAGNVHIGGLMPMLARTLLPISTYAIATALLGPALREAISFRGAVSDTERADNHYRVVGGDRLMWPGRARTWRGDPRRYVKSLLRDIKRAYPQLNGVKAEYAWTEMMGNTVHRMPQIGELSPGLWLLSGFGGHGLNTTAMGGQIIAGAIADGDQAWRLFSPFDLVWAGGVAGRVAVQTCYWSHRTRARRWLAGAAAQVRGRSAGVGRRPGSPTGEAVQAKEKTREAAPGAGRPARRSRLSRARSIGPRAAT